MPIWKDGDLNKEQISAIEEPNNVFLIACPGSGKTRTLTFKIAHELSKIESKKKWVVAITYTNRAADEIQERIELMGISTDQLWIGTIHAFCLEWIIKPYGIYHSALKNGYRIINSHDTEVILSEICSNYSNPRPTYWDCDHFFDSKGINIKCSNNRKANVESVLNKYEDILRSNQQVDFERILWFSYQLISSIPKISEILSKLFKYILIDEFQDTKEIQYQIVSSILRSSNGSVNAFVVGDPNQSIFSSLGGYAISREDFSTMSGAEFKELELSKNYRNSQRIVDYFSNFKVFESVVASEADHKEYESLISYNYQLSHKSIITEISRLIRTSVEQYQIPMSEICVVGPWWIHLASLTRGLVGELPDYRFDGPGLTPFIRDVENIFYKLSRIVLTRPSPTIYVRRLRWAKEVIQYFNDIGINTTKVTPKFFLKVVNSINISDQDGLVFLSKYFDEIFENFEIECDEYQALDEHRKAFFDSAESRKQRLQNEGINYEGDVDTFYKAFEPRNGITVSTIHGVKGTEFDVVIAFALLEGAVPHFNDPNRSESAKKLLYVICSRARKNLHLISETGRNLSDPTHQLQILNYQYSVI